jgi:hypothetical protein
MRPATSARPLRAREFALLVLGQLVFAVVWTYPVALRLGRGELWGGGPDTHQSLWNLWWTKKALVEPGTEWFFSDWIFAPRGMPLALHTFAPLKSLLAIPLGSFFELNDCHNLLMLATFWCAGVSAFLLAYDWLGHFGWAWLGALVFAGAPYHSVHALGHVNLASIEFLPLYFLCLGRVLGGVPACLGGRAAPHAWALGTGAAWALTFWVDFQYALFLVLFTPLFAWVVWRARGEARAAVPLVRALLWAAGSATVLALPLAVPIAHSLFEHGMPAAEGGSAVYSLDLVSVLVPSPFDPLTRPLLAPFLARSPDWYESVERVGTVGVISLVLALAALRGSAAVRRWGAFLLVSWLLSLGPSLRVVGADTGVPLPAALLGHIPGLDQFRAPARFQVLSMLALALLVPAGAAHVLRSLPSAGRRLAGGLVYAAIAVELLALPAIVVPLRVPGAIRFLAAQPDVHAVHVLARAEPEYVWMYWQTLCAKRLLIGKAARIYPEVARAATDEAERLTTALQTDASGRWCSRAELEELYVAAGVRYLVVPRLAAGSRLARLYGEMVDHFFPEGPAFEDGEHAVFVLDVER